jgi:hypothetical protein
MRSLAKTAEEKLAVVREAYLAEAIPAIRFVYNRTNLVRESFILVHCALLGISGFYAGGKRTTGATYSRFVDDFFPSEYRGGELWEDLRCNLVHGYTITKTYVLAHRHPEMHLAQEKGVRNERTGELADLTYLNFEDFLGDFKQAITTYFARAEAEPELIGKLCARYDIAPPATYVSDKDVSQPPRIGGEGQAD